MKNLHFSFKIDDKCIYDEEVLVKKEDKYFTFILDKQNFKFRLDEFHFVKEKEDEKFEIFGGDNPKALITLKGHDAVFDVKIKKFEYNKKGTLHIINYVVESDENSLKTIIFKFM